jgi:hypothetical protein
MNNLVKKPTKVVTANEHYAPVDLVPQERLKITCTIFQLRLLIQSPLMRK